MRPTPQGSTELSGSPWRLTDAFLHSLGAAQALSRTPRVLALSLPSRWRNAKGRLCASPVPVYLRPPCPPASELREAVSCPCCVPCPEPWLHTADAQEILLGSGCKGARGRVQPPGRQASLATCSHHQNAPRKAEPRAGGAGARAPLLVPEPLVRYLLPFSQLTNGLSDHVPPRVAVRLK